MDYGVVYWNCSVSTCKSKRTGLTFCSLPCWEAHVPGMRHRDAWAEEQTAPTRAQLEEQRGQQEKKEAAAAQRRIVSAEPLPSLSTDGLPDDVLVVASKLKKYIKARSGMNTSDSVLQALSDVVRAECDAAIQRAAQDGRRTLMDRDF